MKKNMIITAFLLVFSITSFAQTEKGKFLLGGNASFAKNKHYGNKVITINLVPSAGYFIANNLSVGVGLDYSLRNSPSFKERDIAVIPFARYYFANSGKLRYFAHGGAGISFIKRMVDNDISSIYTNHKFTYTAGLGAAYFFTKNVALEGMLQYDNIKYDNSLGFNIGLKVHF